jgi:hypothetical protein
MFIEVAKLFSFNPEEILCFKYRFLHKIPSGLKENGLASSINIDSLQEFGTNNYKDYFKTTPLQGSLSRCPRRCITPFLGKFNFIPYLCVHQK